jgi:abortive infection bacteriophage resistance protein
MLKRFSKCSLTLDQQIEHLSSHGLEIADEAAAKYWLAHISYYRLSAYWLYSEAPKGTVPRFPENSARCGTGNLILRAGDRHATARRHSRFV